MPALPPRHGPLSLASRDLIRVRLIVVFEAKDQETALVFMNRDPVVLAGVMTAELHPFSVVLARKNLE